MEVSAGEPGSVCSGAFRAFKAAAHSGQLKVQEWQRAGSGCANMDTRVAGLGQGWASAAQPLHHMGATTCLRTTAVDLLQSEGLEGRPFFTPRTDLVELACLFMLKAPPRSGKVGVCL